MRLIFFGSPTFAVPSLDALRSAGHEVALVVTQPDRPVGRGRRPAAPPVALYAREHGLSLWQTSSVRGAEADARLRAVHADGMALAAFAALIPNSVLEMTRRGVLNVHPSLLPRWRGASPIQSALLAGDTHTGISIIRLVQAMDAGPILLQERVPIAPHDDFLTLEPRLAARGAEMLLQALDEDPPGTPQDDAQATYCQKIEREDAHIDWTRPASEIWNAVRGYRGWPQAFTSFDGRALKILRAWPVDHADGAPGTLQRVDGAPVVATGQGGLRLDEVVPEGRKAQSGAEFLRGYPRLIDSRLGSA